MSKSKSKYWFILLAIVLIFSILIGYIILNKGEEAEKSIYSHIEGNVRVQILSSTLIRIEEEGSKGFLNEKTFNIVNRDNWEGDAVTLSLIIKINRQAEGISKVEVFDKKNNLLWKYSHKPKSKLDLPSFNEEVYAFEISDSPRVIPSKWGFSIPTEELSAEEAKTNGWDLSNDATDIYVFFPNNDHKVLRADFINLTGATEMLPLSAFGAWDSRYYKYNQDTAMAQIDGYHSRDLPLDILVIDTDWRNASNGMGYDVNTKLFPDMKNFINDAHNKNVSLMFNDHPEPTKTKGTPNNILAKDEISYRWKSLTSILEMGVDSWWYDRNWSATVIPIDGFTHEVLGMALYAEAQKAVYPNKRLLMMSNVDGVKNGVVSNASQISAHRYSIQWTGDTGGGQETIMNEMYNVLLKGEVSALPYVSTDLGAHNTLTQNMSKQDYIRWMQYGSLSPIFRPHVTSNDIGRMPWVKGEDVVTVFREYINMRYRLLPVFYSLSHENYLTGLPINKTMKEYYPEYSNADRYDQFMLGENILVAPVIQGNSAQKSAERDIWIPEGEWLCTITGESVFGPQLIKVSCDINEMPIYIKKGAAIPLADQVLTTKDSDWSHLTLDYYPSNNQTASSVIYEDDTISNDYQNGVYRKSTINTSFEKGKNIISISKPEGSYSPFEKRNLTLRVHEVSGYGSPKSIKVNGENISFSVIEKNEDAYPLNISGGSRFGKIYELSFEAPISEECKIELEFDSVSTTKKPSGNYDEKTGLKPSAIFFKNENVNVEKEILVETLTEKNVNITEEGTKDWLILSHNGKPVRKENSKNNIKIALPINAHPFADYATTFEWNNGTIKNANGVKSGLYTYDNNDSFDLTIDVTNEESTLILYIGAWSSEGTLSVFDASTTKNMEEFKIDSPNGLSVYKKVTIKYKASSDTKLYISYKRTGYNQEHSNITFVGATLK